MTLKYNAGHRQWYKSRVKLYEYYHHAKCDIYHSVWENYTIQAFATYRHSAGQQT